MLKPILIDGLQTTTKTKLQILVRDRNKHNVKKVSAQTSNNCTAQHRTNNIAEKNESGKNIWHRSINPQS